jgi:uncharacterized integral membrane protein
MKNHFKREGFGMYLYLIGPLLVGLLITIVVQSVRGYSLRRRVPNAVQSSVAREKSN